jgi:ketosteroid isomerase-like protein
MHKLIFALAVTVLTTGPVAASDKTDVMAVVHQWIDGFNKGDAKSSLATCADQAAIIDDIPPYEWHGADACSKWLGDFETDAKKNEITDGIVTLSKPRHLDVTGDRAYVVMPANFAYKQKGIPVNEMGSTVTMVLQKGKAGWRITGWAWAKH